MGRKKDSLTREHFEQIDGISKCKYCGAEYRGKSSATRLRKHLLGGEGDDIKSCPRVPDDVKIALADDSSKRPRIEFPEKEVQSGHQSVPKTSDLDGMARVEALKSLQFMSKDRPPEGFDAILSDQDELRLLQLLCGGNQSPVQGEVHGEMDEVMHRTEPVEGVQDPDHVKKALVDSQNQMQADQEVVWGIDQDCFVIIPESSGDGEPFPTENLVGEAYKKNMDIVLKWLRDDEVSSIGIYGMGGVGKTTLLTHIHNRILSNISSVDNVYWSTVPQDFSIESLQNNIAECIGLDFGKEKDFKKRAAKLSKELRRKGKFVLILDDLWNHFDVHKIGVPIEVNGCKLIFTTRSLEVCRWINCQVELKVEPLLGNEAWILFFNTLGRDLAPEVEHIARAIVRECGGLPLGIVTMARSMRGVDDIHVWINALTELQNSEVRQYDMEAEVFRILRFSYSRLNDPTLQQCLLYCALFPDDLLIEREELIEYLIVEGIIQKRDSRLAAFNKGYTILNTLENVGLLECVSDASVKMHALIRDMAIQIMQECSPSLVAAGKLLTNLPDKKWWTENIVRVSLAYNEIKEIPSHCSPRCPNPSTLLLCNNHSLETIAEPFFYQLHGLKVLNLSQTRIKKLPNSVADLGNLTALILKDCNHLTSLPSLSKLGALEMLDLYSSESFEIVLEGLGSLVTTSGTFLLE